MPPITLTLHDLIGPASGLVSAWIVIWYLQKDLKKCQKNHEDLHVAYLDLTKEHYQLKGKVEGMENQQLPIDLVTELKRIAGMIKKIESAEE